MKLMYLDSETTGVDPKENGICQIAGVIIASGTEEKFNFYMNPGDVIVEPGAMAVNGITIEEMRKAPSSLKVYEDFIAVMDKYVDRYDKKDKFFLIGYNVNFDMEFLRAWFLSHNDEYLGSWFYYPPIDVLQVAAIKMMGKRHLMENMKLATVYKDCFGKEFDDQHSASADIEATREIMNHFFKEGF